jgi:NADH-quinone oxidoreductase subunit B
MSPGRTFRVAEAPQVRVVELGLACCALEVEAAVRAGLLVADDGSPAARTVLLVSGTVTRPLVDAVAAAVAGLPDAAVVAFGACATSGGPYWDAPSVIPGAEQVVPVSLFVPGCPPRPEALIDALVGRGVASTGVGA